MRKTFSIFLFLIVLWVAMIWSPPLKVSGQTRYFPYISGTPTANSIAQWSNTSATNNSLGSIPLAGSGAGVTSGPTSGVTSHDLTWFTSTGGQIADSALSVVGTDSGVASAGTISTTAGTPVCSTANGGITTTTCSAVFTVNTTSLTPANGSLIPINGAGGAQRVPAQEFNAQQIAARAMTITGIQAIAPSAIPSNNTLQFTVMDCTPVNGACLSATTPTTVTCTIPNSGSSCSASGFTAAIAAGDFLDTQFLYSSGTPPTGIYYVGITYQ